QWTDAGFDLGIAVNLSALDLATGNLPAIISGYLEEYGVAPSRLLLEITESTVMRDANHALSVLSELKACGVHLAIDDFGTGYSSLAHLKRLPVDEIKIDKSFIMSMTEDEDDAVIVRSTIELGHNMGLSVVAEGVECERALEMLKQLNCDMAQGFLISKPLPPEELEQWLWDRCDESPDRSAHRHAALKAG
ncbi:MAG: EAL domain-containing protein, partial [Rhodanobacteraceae bacterium]